MRSAFLFGAAVLVTGGFVVVRGGDGSGSGRFGGPPPVAGERFPCTVESVHDGDTLTCREEGLDGRAIRVRLAGIAARELGEDCEPNHPCPDATAEDAAAELARLALGQRMLCEATGQTHRRVAAFCYLPGGVDLSCAMVASGTVAIWPRYWRDHRC